MVEARSCELNDTRYAKCEYESVSCRSLADMVADDECDVTDVRSIRSMWESMDNHR